VGGAAKNSKNERGFQKVRTTNKDFRKQVQQHILEHLNDEETTDTKKQLENVVSEFANYSKGLKFHNIQDAFTSFLQCLPSCLSVEFEYYEIYKNLKKWYESCGETYQEREPEEEANLYYYLIFREFKKLCKIYNVEF